MLKMKIQFGSKMTERYKQIRSTGIDIESNKPNKAEGYTITKVTYDPLNEIGQKEDIRVCREKLAKLLEIDNTDEAFKEAGVEFMKTRGYGKDQDPLGEWQEREFERMMGI